MSGEVSGKIPTTSVRRLISLSRRSSGLVLQIFFQCAVASAMRATSVQAVLRRLTLDRTPPAKRSQYQQGRPSDQCPQGPRPLRSAPTKLVEARLARLKSASLTIAYDKSAPVKSAPSRQPQPSWLRARLCTAGSILAVALQSGLLLASQRQQVGRGEVSFGQMGAGEGSAGEVEIGCLHWRLGRGGDRIEHLLCSHVFRSKLHD